LPGDPAIALTDNLLYCVVFQSLFLRLLFLAVPFGPGPFIAEDERHQKRAHTIVPEFALLRQSFNQCAINRFDSAKMCQLHAERDGSG